MTEHDADTCQHPDCVTHQEVSIDYCIALIGYWLNDYHVIEEQSTLHGTPRTSN
jgi:hypothetical protein